jgi:PiT family inorganic phosphate transporter
MAGLTTVATLVVAAAASLFMAWAIGAGSSGSTPFAPAVGANAIGVMRAGFVVGILGLLGAVLQGANVTEAVGRQLIEGVALTPAAAVIGLTTAAVLVAIGVFSGYPIATAFTVTGATVGVGLALGGAPAWPKYIEIISLWLAVPFVGGGIAYGTARLLRDERVAERLAVPMLGAVVAVILVNVEFVLLGGAGGAASLAGTLGRPLPVGRLLVSIGAASAAGGSLYRQMVADPTVGQRRFLVVLGGLVAFSAGGSQVGLALGPLVPLLDELTVAIPLTLLLVGGGVGLLLGSWMGAPRLIKALAQDYSSLGPRRSIAALIPSFAIAQLAVFFAVPVSFNEIIVSAIVGSGYAADGGGGVSGRKMYYTLVAWVGSLVGAGVIAFGLMSLVRWL